MRRKAKSKCSIPKISNQMTDFKEGELYKSCYVSLSIYKVIFEEVQHYKLTSCNHRIPTKTLKLCQFLPINFYLGSFTSAGAPHHPDACTGQQQSRPRAPTSPQHRAHPPRNHPGSWLRVWPKPTCPTPTNSHDSHQPPLHYFFLIFFIKTLS